MSPVLLPTLTERLTRHPYHFRSTLAEVHTGEQDAKDEIPAYGYHPSTGGHATRANLDAIIMQLPPRHRR